MSDDHCTDLRDLLDAQHAEGERQARNWQRYLEECVAPALTSVLGVTVRVTNSSAAAIREGLDVAAARRRRP